MELMTFLLTTMGLFAILRTDDGGAALERPIHYAHHRSLILYMADDWMSSRMDSHPDKALAFDDRWTARDRARYGTFSTPARRGMTRSTSTLSPQRSDGCGAVR